MANADQGSAGSNGGSPASSVGTGGTNTGGSAGSNADRGSADLGGSAGSNADRGGVDLGGSAALVTGAGYGGASPSGSSVANASAAGIPPTDAQGGAPGGNGGNAGNACGTQQLNLVLLVDKSGSMGNAVIETAPLLWNPLHQALHDFLESLEDTGDSASLTFFPVHGGYDTACSVASYESPAVPLTELGSPDGLLGALDATEPGGGTPTLPAVMGSIHYARQREEHRVGSQSIVIVLTGGEPVVVDSNGEERIDDCPPGFDNTIENIVAAADAAYAGSPSVPVYVIGFGAEAQALAPVAAAGGTQYYDVSGDTTEGNAAVVLAALQEIRAIETACPLFAAAGAGQ